MAKPNPWNIPNTLTLLRILAVPIFGWMLLSHPGDFTWRIWTTVVFVLAIATDALDGRIARSYEIVTDFGKIWDPIADKALTGMAFVGLSIIGELPWWVTVIILIREWGITAMRGAILKYGVMAANAGGKLKTVMQSVALVLYLPGLMNYPLWLQWTAIVVMGIAFILTVATGLDYLRVAWQMKRDYEAKTGQ